VGSPDVPRVSAFHAADDVKAPGFCCRVPGNAEGGLGHLQVSAFIGIYFGLLRLWRFAFRIVGIGFLALSKPVRPHQMRPAAAVAATNTAGFEPAAKPFSPEVANASPCSQGASGGAGGNRTPVQHTSTSTFRAFAHTIIFQRRPIKAYGELVEGDRC